MIFVLALLLVGAGGYLTWKELEARHNLERIRLTESFQVVAAQQAVGFLRRFLMALCFMGAAIAIFYILSPDSMREAFQLATAILERVGSPR